METYDLLEGYVAASRIPLQLWNGNGCVRSFPDYVFEPNPAVMMTNSFINSDHQICYTVSDEFICCGRIRIIGCPEYWIVGPAPIYACSYKQAQKILIAHGQSLKRTEELLHWLSSIPPCDITRFRTHLLFISRLMNGPDVCDRDLVCMPYQKAGSEVWMSRDEPSYVDYFDADLELRLLSCVENGRPDELKQILDDIDEQADGFPVQSEDSVRDFRTIFIYATGTVSSAALRGGLDYGTKKALSDYYLKEIYQIEGYAMIFRLLCQMFMDFANRTKRCQNMKNQSPLVNRINRIICAHLYEKMTPSRISEILGMNCSYICRHFKEQTGKTLSTYINEVKMKEAKRLMKISNRTVADIALQLGYSSQNYFITVFKKVEGVTPGTYIRTNQILIEQVKA